MDKIEVGQQWIGRINHDVVLTVVKITAKTDTVTAITQQGEQIDYVKSTFNEYYYLAPCRALFVIANDIDKHWHPVWFGAVPYLQAMHQLQSINEDYYADSAYSVVQYFLGNAAQFKGVHAKRIKAELKYICKQAR